MFYLIYEYWNINKNFYSNNLDFVNLRLGQFASSMSKKKKQFVLIRK